MSDPTSLRPSILSNPKCNTAVRQTSLSRLIFAPFLVCHPWLYFQILQRWRSSYCCLWWWHYLALGQSLKLCLHLILNCAFFCIFAFSEIIPHWWQFECKDLQLSSVFNTFSHKYLKFSTASAVYCVSIVYIYMYVDCRIYILIKHENHN